MPEKEDVDDTNNFDDMDIDDMEKEVNRLRKDRVEDLVNTAAILGSWMSDQKLTIAEQLATIELLRSSVLVNYIQMQQMRGMAEFVKDNPHTQVVMVKTEPKQPPGKPRVFNPGDS